VSATSEVPIPEDAQAERVVAVCMAESARGARLALERVAPSDFWHPPCRRVAQAVADHAAHLAAVEMAAAAGQHTDGRLNAVATLARVERRTLDEWAADAPVAVDQDGRYAGRVRNAAIRRRELSEGVNESAVAEGPTRGAAMKAQTAVVAPATARICNAQGGVQGRSSGHGGFVHTFSDHVELRVQRAGLFHRLHDGDQVLRRGTHGVERAHHGVERHAGAEHEQVGLA